MRFLPSPLPQLHDAGRGRSYVIRPGVAGTPCEAPSVLSRFEDVCGHLVATQLQAAILPGILKANKLKTAAREPDEGES